MSTAIGPGQLDQPPHGGPPVRALSVSGALRLEEAHRFSQGVKRRGMALDCGVRGDGEEARDAVFGNDLSARRAAQVDGVLADDLAADRVDGAKPRPNRRAACSARPALKRWARDRSMSSSAAFTVKVVATISSGARASTSPAMSRTMRVVLPAPAEATTVLILAALMVSSPPG